MNLKAIIQHRFLIPAMAALVTAIAGVALLNMVPGEPLVNSSYDYLFRFGSRVLTNEVVVVLMDNDAYDQYAQSRERPWDRWLHAKLLNRLADDQCAMVVIDAYFGEARDPQSDQQLVSAIQRHRHLVLMAKQASPSVPGIDAARPLEPIEPFRSAAKTNWGAAFLHPDLDGIVREHWPSPSPGPYPSLPWTAAKLAGARLSDVPQRRWLRYYGERGAWLTLSYAVAFMQAPGFFRDKVVFIGNSPESPIYNAEDDEFRTPYTRWTGETAGGVEIQVAAFLNLVNGDWLRRPPPRIEKFLFALAGLMMGATACRLRPRTACFGAGGVALATLIGAVLLSHFTHYWFPWLILAAAQTPCAVLCSFGAHRIRRMQERAARAAKGLPDTPDYEIFEPAIGEGAFGKVWLVRNAIGEWQALKAVYQAKFKDPGPYEREFYGIKKYKPLSHQHPDLLHVDFVTRNKREGYFYYVMELGDSDTAGWQEDPSKYSPCDLNRLRKQMPGNRLPIAQCVEIGITLANALQFLHSRNLTHRDVKPSNIILVNGRPKLADVGLVTEIRLPEEVQTWAGTAGYAPPQPEPPGTAEADIYGLGMVLYVLSTGSEPRYFPELSTSLMEMSNEIEFILLNPIILKACHPSPIHRYKTAAEVGKALLEVQQQLQTPARQAAG